MLLVHELEDIFALQCEYYLNGLTDTLKELYTVLTEHYRWGIVHEDDPAIIGSQATR